MFDRILIVDDDDVSRQSLEPFLGGEGHLVLAATSGEDALRILGETLVDVVLCESRMPGLEGFDLIPQISRQLPGIPIILMAARAVEELAAEAIQRGAFDCLAKPFNPAEIQLALLKARERERLRRQNVLLERDASRALGDRPIVAASDAMIELLEVLERRAGSNASVLISGERGTGKEVIARAIHGQSPRREAPFVVLQCGGMTEQRFESELFGHVTGAFEGARHPRRGLFAIAERGTLFLDEIAELPSPVQLKLLRAIEEEAFHPLGEREPVKTDVRVIAATARDLEVEIREGRFQKDLFDQLNTGRLDVPPLRERREDIPLLVDHCLGRFRRDLGKPIRGITEEALERLLHHSWPGNVRELENVIERAMILAQGVTIEAAALPPLATTLRLPTDPASMEGPHEDLDLRRGRQAFEAELIRQALRRTDGNRTHAAKLLGISHRALLYKLKDYEIRD